MQDERIPRPMTAAQRERHERGEVELLDQDRFIEEWLPELLFETGTPAELTVGIFRCPSGEITCPEGECSESCDCCDHDKLWESPLLWEPRCMTCDRPALLVDVSRTLATAQLFAA